MCTEDKLSRLYEKRIEEIKKSNEREISHLKDYIKSLEGDKFSLKCTACITSVALVFFLVMVLIISNAR